MHVCAPSSAEHEAEDNIIYEVEINDLDSFTINEGESFLYK